MAPLGSSLTLTIVLLASLAPQPAGATGGAPEGGAAGPDTAVRGSAQGEIMLGWTLWFDQAGPALLPLPCWPPTGVPAAVTRGEGSRQPHPTPPSRSCVPRGP